MLRQNCKGLADVKFYCLEFKIRQNEFYPSLLAIHPSNIMRVVNPEHMGAQPIISCGVAGHISDLARVPHRAHGAVPLRGVGVGGTIAQQPRSELATRSLSRR